MAPTPKVRGGHVQSDGLRFPSAALIAEHITAIALGLALTNARERK